MTAGQDNTPNVRAGVYDGEFYWDKTGTAAAPTGFDSPLDPLFKPLGFIAEGGPEVSNLMNEGDSTNIKAWQRAATVRVIRTPSEDQPTFAIEFIENNIAVIEAAFGTTVVRDADSGNYRIDSNVAHLPGKGVLDVIDLPRVKRYYGPNMKVTSVEVTGYPNDAAEGYKITFVAEPSPELDGAQLDVWDTLLADTDSTPIEP